MPSDIPMSYWPPSQRFCFTAKQKAALETMKQHVRRLDLGQSDVHVDTVPKRSPMKTLEDLKRALAAGDITQEEFDEKKKALEEATKKMGDGSSTVDCDDGVEMYARGDSVVLEMKSAAEPKPVWIQLAKPGKFKGHVAGSFEMNAAVFRQIIANFEAQENKFIPVDFEHASEQSPTQGSIPYSGAPAQGWITKLELRADGNLWGLVSWGDLARGYIKKGQYKFLSPAIVFGAKDRVTGKVVGARLSSVALTNNPFLDGMAPVAAKRQDSIEVATAMSAIRTTFGVPEFVSTPAQMLALLRASDVDGVREDIASKLRDALRLPLTMSNEEVFNAARVACGAINPPTAAVSASVTDNNDSTPTTAQGDPMGDQNKDKDKDTEISSLTLKLTNAEAEKTRLMSEHTTAMKAVTEENDKLKLKLAEYEEREIATLVDGAYGTWGATKGLTAEQRPHLLRLAKNDRDAFIAMFPPPAKGAPVTDVTGKLVAASNHNVPPLTTPSIAPVIDINDATKDIPSIEDIAGKIMADAKGIGKNMTREEAFSRAFTERNKLFTAARKKAAGNGG